MRKLRFARFKPLGHCRSVVPEFKLRIALVVLCRERSFDNHKSELSVQVSQIVDLASRWSSGDAAGLQ
ncbi:hypothetical protein M404DRAFT_996070 [Pisolithus tinctorius Marx 270]|uniref:Uncharacterized protein n=1 Tax=Pisolithus tinctorius Marx 270 TaxID=870435 RepID=A0A0C3KKH1_PISTI|nr:hypothetical protein M404DRAFT_996070 [Pisolithus tinctorius Marx 270]